MIEKLVSVIIVTYNQREFIKECIDSVLSQTYKNIKIIVTDDASTDGTQEILEELNQKLSNRLNLVFSQKNTGITGNCNRGFLHAEGDYICWMGGDDLFLPSKIEKQVQVFEQDSEMALVATDVIVHYINGSRSDTVVRCPVMSRGGNYRQFIRQAYHIPTSSFMFRHEFVKNLKFDERLRCVSDWLYNVKAAMCGKIGYVHEPLTIYRRTGQNVTEYGSQKTYLDDRLISLDILLHENPHLWLDLEVARSKILLSAAQRYAGDNLFSESLSLLLNSIKIYPVKDWRLPLLVASTLLRINPYKVRKKIQEILKI